MRFSSSVDSLSKENRNLRITVTLLATSVIGLTLGVLLLYDRQPILVESTNHGVEVLRVVPMTRTERDLQEGIRLMLKARFNTSAINPEAFLSTRQMDLREAEQKEMRSRGISQEIVFRSAKVTKAEAAAEFDRVLSVGDVRSALKTSVKIAFEEVEPNELNPYGLILALASPLGEKEGVK